jgi:CheY-like chemotaxis protein
MAARQPSATRTTALVPHGELQGGLHAWIFLPCRHEASSSLVCVRGAACKCCLSSEATSLTGGVWQFCKLEPTRPTTTLDGHLSSSRKGNRVARNRVLIAHPNPAIRQALIDLLQETSEFVATPGDEESVAGLVEAVNPNLILLGVTFGGMSGFEIARRLRQSKCPAKIIIISMHESPDLVRGALGVGASGYVFVSRLLDDLPTAIETVCAGGVFEPGP